MNKAAFSLENYRFEKIEIDYSNYSKDISIKFTPSGEYDSKKGVFKLSFIFTAINEEENLDFVKIECVSEFEFEEKLSFEEIPGYFYRNSIAIVFPYMRSFVSTVTLQANVNPIILPTLNLSDLEKPLKENTVNL